MKSNLENLGMYTRTKESTIGAVKDTVGGVIGVITGGNKGRFSSAMRIVEGVGNAIDVIPSAAADTLRLAIGPEPEQGLSNNNYNITRGLSSFKKIRKPQHVISAIADTAHAAVFRPGTDLARLLGGNQNFKNN